MRADRGGAGLGASPVIVVEDLRKTYGDVEALRGISFSVAEGEVLGLLGPNGAGKTTTVEILEGHRRRSGGRVSVLGLDPHSGGRGLRERIGIVLQSAGIDGDLAVDEVLRLYAGFYPRRRDIDEVIEIVGLTEKRHAWVRTLSGGQCRRLDLALALVGDPDVIFLDEPTTGFDPNARRRAWTIIEDLRDLGKTILLTSHYLDEIQRLADRVLVVNHGRIVAEGPPDRLGGRHLDDVVVTFRLPPWGSADDLPAAVRAGCSVDGDRVSLCTASPTEALHALTTWALTQGCELDGLSVLRPSLEDVYLRLTEDTPGDQP